MRSKLSAMRSMLAESKLGPQDWASVLPAIASALHEASLGCLGRNSKENARSPLEVMTGILPNRQILRILPSGFNHSKAKNIDHARALEVIHIEELQKALEHIHKDVERSVSLRRDSAITAHNKAENIIQPQFITGDFVLVRRATNQGHKLQFRWFVPCRITAAHSPLFYGVSPLRGGTTDKDHCTRLLNYRDSLLGEPVPQKMLDLTDRTETQFEVVEKIIDIGKALDRLFFQVQWEGLPDKQDWTWQSVKELYKNISDVMSTFHLTTKKMKVLVKKIKRQPGIQAQKLQVSTSCTSHGGSVMRWR